MPSSKIHPAILSEEDAGEGGHWKTLWRSSRVPWLRDTEALTQQLSNTQMEDGSVVWDQNWAFWPAYSELYLAWAKHCTSAETIKPGGGSLMLWGRSSATGPGRFMELLDGKMEAVNYRKIQEENLLYSARELQVRRRFTLSWPFIKYTWLKVMQCTTTTLK